MAWTATIWSVDDPGDAERFGIAPRVLGGAQGVWARLRRSLPGLYARGSDGWLAGEGWRMRLTTLFQLVPVARGAVDAVEVDVDGEGDPLPLLAQLCSVHGWSLFDDEAGCFVDLDDPAGTSWEGPAATPPRPSLVARLVPRAFQPTFARREIVLLDLSGAPDVAGAERAGPEALDRFPLGHADDVRERLLTALPGLAFSGRRGRLVADDGRLHVFVREVGLVDTLRLQVAGPAADPWLHAVCALAGWSAWDVGARRFCVLHQTAQEALHAARRADLPDNVVLLRP